MQCSSCIRRGKYLHKEGKRQQHIKLSIYADAIYILIFVAATFRGYLKNKRFKYTSEMQRVNPSWLAKFKS